jgi:hypothetical protein
LTATLERAAGALAGVPSGRKRVTHRGRTLPEKPPARPPGNAPLSPTTVSKRGSGRDA